MREVTTDDLGVGGVNNWWRGTWGNNTLWGLGVLTFQWGRGEVLIPSSNCEFTVVWRQHSGPVGLYTEWRDQWDSRLSRSNVSVSALSHQQENRPCSVDKSEHMFTKWQPIKSDVCTRTFQLLSYLTNFLSVILPVCLTFLKQISYLYYSSCKN